MATAPTWDDVLETSGGEASTLSKDELRQMITFFRRRITRSWWAEQKLKAELPLGLPETIADADRGRVPWEHIGMNPKQERLYERLNSLEYDRSIDEDDLVKCGRALIEFHDGDPGPWHHPGTNDMRHQVVREMRFACGEVAGDEDWKAMRRRLETWLAADLSVPTLRISQLSWLQCQRVRWCFSMVRCPR